MELTPSKPAALCFSYDFNLLFTRQLLLERCGCLVLCAMSISEFRERLRQRSVALVVLCHSLSKEECAAVEQMTREQMPPTQRIMLDTGHFCGYEASGAYLVGTAEGPAAFIRSVEWLLMTCPPVPPAMLASAMLPAPR